jgi:hypothetical protein
MTEQEQDEHLKKCLKLIDEWAEKNKPPTLYQIIQDKLGYSPDSAQQIVDVVAEWIPHSSTRNGYEWEKCLKLMREKLQ